MNLNALQIGPAETLGWTLIHFLWQGAIVAALLKLILNSLARSSAQLRYVAACGGMAALVVCPLVTFSSLQADSAISRGFRRRHARDANGTGRQGGCDAASIRIDDPH